jgi:hypothetical protein
MPPPLTPPLLVARAHPSVWVRRVVLYRSTNPVDEIRTIPLRRGLNIIHGVGEGHSVGKSTFCRLLRYCLGEDRFCDQDRRSDFRYALEYGAIAAEILIGNRAWSVVRPLGAHGSSKALPESSIDQVLIADAATAPWAAYQEALAAVTVGRHEALPLSNGKPISWLDVLAACTRDQDARLDDVVKWRPHQVQSVPDSTLVLRAVLGLLHAEEARSRLEVERLEREREQKLLQIQRLETLGRTRFADHWDHLRKLAITAISADDAWNGTIANADGITDLLAPHLSAASVPDASGDELTAANDRVQRARLDERDRHQAVRRLELARQLAEAKKSKDSKAVTDALAELRHLADSGTVCPIMPEKPLAECKHVLKKLDTTAVVIADTVQEEQEYRAAVVANERQLGTARPHLAAAIAERAQAERQVSQWWEKRTEAFQHQHKLQMTASALVRSLGIRDGSDSELTAVTSQLQGIATKLDQARERRNSHLKQARSDRTDVQALYHWIVSTMAGAGHQGKVDISDQRIDFDMKALHAGGGLAYRTMAVPYADFAALLRGIAGSGCHPGILIHDSPREADANEQLYHSLFRLAHGLEASLTPAGQEPPFQYIITTTTAPPSDLQGKPWLALQLSSNDESELLFCKSIKFPRQETNES